MVDTAVAQRVADEWQAAPVVGALSAVTVQRIVVSAQQVAQQAVSTSRQQPQPWHIDGTPADSARRSGSHPAGAGVHDAAAVGHLGATSERASSGGGGGVGVEADGGSFVGGVAATWAAISKSLLRRIPGPLSAVLQRLQQQRGVRHLEASLASGDPSAQARLLFDSWQMVAPCQALQKRHQVCHREDQKSSA